METRQASARGREVAGRARMPAAASPRSRGRLARSRSPGSRIVLLAPPSHAFRRSGFCRDSSPVTVAGAAPACGPRCGGPERLPFFEEHLSLTSLAGRTSRPTGPGSPRGRAARETAAASGATAGGPSREGPACVKSGAHNFEARAGTPHEAVALSPGMDDPAPVQPGPITWRRHRDVEDWFLPSPSRPGRTVARGSSMTGPACDAAKRWGPAQVLRA